MKLSANFSLHELTKSQTASRKGIDNRPGNYEIHNLQELTTNVLQPVRDAFGPVFVSSGYRCPALNVAVGGSEKSQHMFGMAADIECFSYSNVVLYEWIRDNLEYDQLILEFYDGTDPHSGWVHVSYNPDGNRKHAFEIN